VSAELPALDDVGARRITRHEDVRFEPSARGIRGQRAAGVPCAGDGELRRAEIFCHRNGHTHPARLETLRRVQRFVFDPKIDVVIEFLCVQQWCSAFTQRNRLNVAG